jgi:hypothetical protein
MLTLIAQHSNEAAGVIEVGEKDNIEVAVPFIVEGEHVGGRESHLSVRAIQTSRGFAERD